MMQSIHGACRGRLQASYRGALLVIAVAAAAAGAGPQPAHAQSPAGAPSVAGTVRTEWYTATYFRYKPDRVPQAKQLVREHFWPVDKVLSPELVVFEFVTGDWHQVAYFPLEGGPGALASGEKSTRWMALLSERENGREQAERVLAEWRAMIAETRTEIVRRPVLW